MKNNSENNKKRIKPEDERFIRILKKIMPNLFTVLKEIIRKIENFDPSCPQTSLMEVENLFGSLRINLHGREKLIIRAIRLFLRKLDIKEVIISQLHEVIKNTKKEASKDRRYSLLLKLMREADKKFPYVSINVAMRHGDPREWIIPQCNPMPFLQQTEALKGEHRASAVLEAFRRSIEYLYVPYITTLWHLAYFREGKNLHERPDVMKISFGQLLEVSSEKLKDYPQLIEPNVGWMRNCITHEIPKYDIKTDSWEMKNSKSQIIKVKVDELLKLTENLYQISTSTIARVGQLYLFREFFLESGLLEVLADNLPTVILEADKNKEIELEKKITNHIQQMFGLS